MSYKLTRPYTDKERADFVHEHQGLKSYEDDNCIIMYPDTEKIVDGEAVDRTQDADYIAKQKKQLIQSEFAKYKRAINDITNAKLIDELQNDNGSISDSVYNSRKTIRLAQFNQVRNTYYTNTGLTPPATITA